jgi:ABC-type multidrug transport system ATPase subunit/pSer/pThr/pTyr-binding forkhead associated (FHA) protein
VGNPVAQRPHAAPALLVRTRRSDHRLESGTEYRIGRDPAADIVLSDARVSWHHAVLKTDGAGWVLEDTGSRNGIFVGTEQTRRVDIRTNCVVRIGNPDDGPVLRFEPQLPQEPPPVSVPVPMPVPAPAPAPARISGGLVREPVQEQEAEILASLPSVDRRPTARMPLPSKVMRIGRTPDNDLVVSDLGVSREHAELRKSVTGRYEIIDLGSHNGTFVNGSRIDRAELGDSDIISIGHATFRLADGELREYVDEGNVSFEARELFVQVSDGGKPKVLLQGITFPLPERSLLAVIGPAGAGKSTLLNALTGKRPADQGTVLYDKRDLYKSYEELRHRIGLVPQQSVTHDQLTARSALGYAAELRFPPDTGASERRGRVEEVLGELEMSQHGDTRVERLSGGQNKRVNIGLELLTKPSLLFLDEPTSPLDPHLKRELMERMRRMADGAAEKGQSVVVITHDVEPKLLDLADRLIVLAPGGKMAYFGPPKEGLKYFGKADWADVFKEFSDQPQKDWMAEYKASRDYARYVTEPMTERAPQPLPPDAPQREEPPPPRQRGRISQLSTLSRRYARVMSVDRGYMLFTILLPLILGAVVRVIPSPEGLGGLPKTNTDAIEVLLILVMSACLAGTANSVREIVKERDIFERERMAGLSSGAYLSSKVLVLGVVSVVQTLLIVVIGVAGRPMPKTGSLLTSAPLVEIAIAVAVLCFVSMLIGLAISSMVTKSEQTMPALVVVTMIQVVLSGGVIPLTGAIRWVSSIAPARWGMGALGSTTSLSVITPGQAPDALWQHTPVQWLTDIGFMILIGLICLAITQWRLGKLGPGHRK